MLVKLNPGVNAGRLLNILKLGNYKLKLLTRKI